MASPTVLEKGREEGVKLSQRGETLVRVERMLPHLREYHFRKVADFLKSGFQDGFCIPLFCIRASWYCLQFALSSC